MRVLDFSRTLTTYKILPICPKHCFGEEDSSRAGFAVTMGFAPFSRFPIAFKPFSDPDILYVILDLRLLYELLVYRRIGF
jgi:hypothetical protein